MVRWNFHKVFNTTVENFVAMKKNCNEIAVDVADVEFSSQIVPVLGVL